MRLSVCSILLTSFLFNDRLPAPGFIDNGGDVVQCKASHLNDLNGMYALDYVLTRTEQNGDQENFSWDLLSKSLMNVIAQHEDLQFTYQRFLSSLPSQLRPTSYREWIQREARLKDLKDERIIREVPLNCKDEKGEPRILQAVVRIQTTESVYYEYDEDILKHLQENRPLQLSYLLIHEWLWDHETDVRIIRNINHYLHSQLQKPDNVKMFRMNISNYGMTMLPHQFPSVCFRSKTIRNYILERRNFQCEDLESSDLIGFELLNLRGSTFKHIKYNDLTGMNHLSTFLADNSQIQYIDSTTFSNTPKLEFLSLSNNNLKSISPKIFESFRHPIPVAILSNNSLKNLVIPNEKMPSSLFLNHNELESLPQGLFGIIKRDSSLRKSGLKIFVANNNKIKRLPPTTRLSPSKSIRYFDISSNLIEHFDTNLCPYFDQSQPDFHGDTSFFYDFRDNPWTLDSLKRIEQCFGSSKLVYGTGCDERWSNCKK